MTGAEHYAEAERFLSLSEDEYIGSPNHTACFQRAQVHATLAQVAATIDAVFIAAGESTPGLEWRVVLMPADGDSSN